MPALPLLSLPLRWLLIAGCRHADTYQRHAMPRLRAMLLYATRAAMIFAAARFAVDV